MSDLFAWTPEAFRIWVFAGAIVAAAAVDQLRGIIPNMLVIIGLALSVVLHTWLDGAEMGSAIAAAASASAALLIVRWIGLLLHGSPGMGMGDVKLAFVVGLLLGWQALWVLYLAVLMAGLFALGGLVLGTVKVGARMPFAPFIAGAALVNATIFPVPYLLLR